MFFQNVTSLDLHHQLFNLHHVDLTGMSDVSVHFEMHPLVNNLSYLLIYRFDHSPVLNTSLQQIDGWSLFCPASKETLLFCLLDLPFSFRSLECKSLYFVHRQPSNFQPSFADLWSSWTQCHGNEQLLFEDQWSSIDKREILFHFQLWTSSVYLDLFRSRWEWSMEIRWNDCRSFDHSLRNSMFLNSPSLNISFALTSAFACLLSFFDQLEKINAAHCFSSYSPVFVTSNPKGAKADPRSDRRLSSDTNEETKPWWSFVTTPSPSSKLVNIVGSTTKSHNIREIRQNLWQALIPRLVWEKSERIRSRWERVWVDWSLSGHTHTLQIFSGTSWIPTTILSSLSNDWRERKKERKKERKRPFRGDCVIRIEIEVVEGCTFFIGLNRRNRIERNIPH